MKRQAKTIETEEYPSHHHPPTFYPKPISFPLKALPIICIVIYIHTSYFHLNDKRTQKCTAQVVHFRDMAADCGYLHRSHSHFGSNDSGTRYHTHQRCQQNSSTVLPMYCKDQDCAEEILGHPNTQQDSPIALRLLY